VLINDTARAQTVVLTGSGAAGGAYSPRVPAGSAALLTIPTL